MPTQSLFDGTIATLQKTLNAGSLRHKVLTSNIANIDTPNYKAFEVVMEDALKRNNRSAGPIELVRTRPRHLSGRYSSSNPIKIKAADSPANQFEGRRQYRRSRPDHGEISGEHHTVSNRRSDY